MKKALFFKLSLLFVSALCLPHSFAQDSPQWSLPEGAKARLGKGRISEIQYSPDGTRVAVASSIGIWLYDTATHQEVALLTGHTSGVASVAFSPDGRTIASGIRVRHHPSVGRRYGRTTANAQRSYEFGLERYVQSRRTYSRQWGWELGHYHPSVGRRYRKTPAIARRTCVWGLERCVQSRWGHTR